LKIETERAKEKRRIFISRGDDPLDQVLLDLHLTLKTFSPLKLHHHTVTFMIFHVFD